MTFESEPPRRPVLWDAWTHWQLVIFALLLLGAELFWWAVIYRLTSSAFAASIVSVAVAVVLPCGMAAWWHGETLVRAFQFRPRPTAALVGVAAGLLSWAPASFLASLSSRLYPPSPEYLALLAENMPNTPVETAIAYLAVSLAAPVGEELIFRGILFRVLRDRWGWLRAAIITALFFGVVHAAPWNLFGLVALGLLLAMLYHLTRSLLTSMLAHAAYNAVALTLLIGRGDLEGAPAATGLGASGWILLITSSVLLALLLGWLWRRARQEAAIRPEDDPR